MNKTATPEPTAPNHALLTPQKPMHREPPLWTSCLTSKPLWSGDPADLPRPRTDRSKPLFPVLETILGTWDPARHPLYRVAPQQPMHREAVGSPPPVALAACAGKGANADMHRRDEGGEVRQGPSSPPPNQPPAVSVSPPQNPMHRETPPIGPLRNGNPRGNPNLAPRCGARTRAGCPCKGPAMKNGRCRMHGGASTGPKTPEGRARIAAARTTSSPEFRALQAQTALLTARNRVLLAAVKTGLPMEDLAPLIHRIKPETRYSPYAVSPLLLLGTDLTPAEARALIALIRDPTVVPGTGPMGAHRVRVGGQNRHPRDKPHGR